MKRHIMFKAPYALFVFVLASLVMMNGAMADGTEQLGPPSIAIEDGSEIVVAGTGLDAAQPQSISVEIPADVTIAQVLLYWSGRSEADPGNDDTIQVEGEDVMGSRIGGPTPPPTDYPSSTYRADITDLSGSNGWIQVDQMNELEVMGLDFDYSNDGAAVVVILDDGSMTDIQIMDGNDWAWEPEGSQTEAVEFPVAASSDPQTGYLWLIVSDVDVPRPAAIDITVDGVTTRLADALMDNEGSFLDVVGLEVSVPAGATNVIVQLFSIDDGSDLLPASLAWSFVSWELPEPVDEGCTYTKGYWKNHEEDWPEELIIYFDMEEAMDILWTPPKRGNAWYILAHQYIAAGNNVANGASIPDDVLDAWIAGEELLMAYDAEMSIPKRSDDRDDAIAYAKLLDQYNNGEVGPGHCGDGCSCD